MALHTLKFGTVNLTNYGWYVQDATVFDAPDLTPGLTKITGRSGLLPSPLRQLGNVEIKYTLSHRGGNISEHLDELKALIVSEQLKNNGSYVRIEDDYYPEHYRMGVLTDTFDIDTFRGHFGVVKVTFSCKPQRYLKSGDLPITIKESGTKIHNPTGLPAFPYLEKLFVSMKTGQKSGYINIGGIDILAFADKAGGVTTITGFDAEDQYFSSAFATARIYSTIKSGVMDGDAVTVSDSVFVFSVTMRPRWYNL